MVVDSHERYTDAHIFCLFTQRSPLSIGTMKRLPCLTFIILLTAILLMPNFNARLSKFHSPPERDFRYRKCSISCLVSLFLGLHKSWPHRLRSFLSFHVILSCSDSLQIAPVKTSVHFILIHVWLASAYLELVVRSVSSSSYTRVKWRESVCQRRFPSDSKREARKTAIQPASPLRRGPRECRRFHGCGHTTEGKKVLRNAQEIQRAQLQV